MHEWCDGWLSATPISPRLELPWSIFDAVLEPSPPQPFSPRGHEEASNVSRGFATGQNSGFLPRDIYGWKVQNAALGCRHESA